MPTTEIILNTQDFGGVGLDARVGGRLELTSGGCLVVNDGSGVIDVVWPAGFVARETPAGTVQVIDGTGVAVAETGREFFVGGGHMSPSAELACRGSDRAKVLWAMHGFEALDAPAVVTVPDVVGLTQSGARAALSAARLVATVTYDPSATNVGSPSGTVSAQQPQPGTRVDAHAHIQLVVDAPDPEPDPQLGHLLVDYAQGRGVFVPFAEHVVLGLGDQFQRTVPGDALRDAETWVFAECFAGRTPPFSALDTLRRTGRDYRVRIGRLSHRAGPPIEPPAPLGGLRQVSILPTRTGAGLDGLVVDLFVDDRDRIAGVVLDLYEP